MNEDEELRVNTAAARNVTGTWQLNMADALNGDITMCLKFNLRYTASVSTIYFILKQGYMFRLEVSHLQDLTTFFVTRCFAHSGIPQCLQLWNTY
jgi:hypothetical protein